MKQKGKRLLFSTFDNLYRCLSVLVCLLAVALLVNFRARLFINIDFGPLGYWIGTIILVLGMQLIYTLGARLSRKIKKTDFGEQLDKYRKEDELKYNAQLNKYPSLSEFGLTKEEFDEYSSRRKIDSEFITSILGFIFLFLIIYLLNGKSSLPAYSLILSGISILLTIKFIIDRIQLKLAKGFKQHEKASSYLKALNKYYANQRNSLLKEMDENQK